MTLKDARERLIECFETIYNEGIEGADYLALTFLQNHDDEDWEDSLYFTAFNGEDRVMSGRKMLESGEYIEDRRVDDEA